MWDAKDKKGDNGFLGIIKEGSRHDFNVLIF